MGKGKPFQKGHISWMKGKHHSEEARRKLSEGKVGAKNPAWLGGKYFEPYTLEFNESFKEVIRIREAFLCIKCGMREEDSKILLKRKLVCHHIDYNKSNTCKENCCALCSRCNVEVNINRERWTQFFQSLLSERYGYIYVNGDILIKI